MEKDHRRRDRLGIRVQVVPGFGESRQPARVFRRGELSEEQHQSFRQMIMMPVPTSAVPIDAYASFRCCARASASFSAFSERRTPAYVKPASDASMSRVWSVRL